MIGFKEYFSRHPKQDQWVIDEDFTISEDDRLLLLKMKRSGLIWVDNKKIYMQVAFAWFYELYKNRVITMHGSDFQLNVKKLKKYLDIKTTGHPDSERQYDAIMDEIVDFKLIFDENSLARLNELQEQHEKEFIRSWNLKIKLHNWASIKATYNLVRDFNWIYKKIKQHNFWFWRQESEQTLLDHFKKLGQNITKRIRLKYPEYSEGSMKLEESESKWLDLVKQDPMNILYCKNPTVEMQHIAVNANSHFIEAINDPSEEIQMLAVKQEPMHIWQIKNPTARVLTYIKLRDPELYQRYIEIKS